MSTPSSITLCATVLLLPVMFCAAPDDSTTGAAGANPVPRPSRHAHVTTLSPDTPLGQGEMVFTRGGIRHALPLHHTDVNGRIEGLLARMSVAQRFVNASDTTIEALYVFPLPRDAAVDSMVMTVGDSRIRGVITEREQARRSYERARRTGRTASLLEQERPNVFTQSVANILPHDTILVTISYVQPLTCRGGTVHFVFPMVVGPRYIPGRPIAPATRGTVPPTDQVPDAPGVTPPMLPEDVRSGHDISLHLSIRAGAPVRRLACPSHKVAVEHRGDSLTTVHLLANDHIPNKDFILDYDMAGAKLRGHLLCERRSDTAAGYFQLIVAPPVDTSAVVFHSRELVFVVDNSGSMRGRPIATCRSVMRDCLRGLRRDDVFRVIRFAGSTEVLSTSPLPATDGAVERALGWVETMRGGGGTEMMGAIEALFDAPEEKGRRRIVLFMTDGLVGNEQALIRTARERLGHTRVFTLGVGSSVNRFLLDGLAYVGRGECRVIRHDGDAEEAAGRFYRLIQSPVLTDISLEWEGVDVVDMQPARLPDLFRAHPLVAYGRYLSAGTGTVTIRGRIGGGAPYALKLPVRFAARRDRGGVMPVLWARRAVRELTLLGGGVDPQRQRSSAQVRDRVLALGLRHRIMTSYTSFVAVDDAVRSESGEWIPVEQPVEIPQGIDPVSHSPGRYASRVGRAGIASAAVFGNGGAAPGIDAVLKGIGGLKAGGGAGTGYGAGYGSGFGGGSGGVDDQSAGLTGGGIASPERGRLTLAEPAFSRGASLSGGRSKAGIMRVVIRHVAALRYEYNRRLREKPGLNGTIVVKFAIDDSGKVTACRVVQTTVNDSTLEKRIVAKIKRWTFDTIDMPGDTTEVVYPFVFRQ